jgi:hypothetical protein
MTSISISGMTVRQDSLSRRRRPWAHAVAALAIAAASCSTLEVPTAPEAGPFTDVFASQLGVRGSATRSFTVREPGAVSATLTSVGPPATLEVGLGVGIPNGSGAGCNLTKSVVTTAGSSPQLTIDADGGAYCVRVFDVGNLTGDVTFSVSVLHP